MNRNGRSGPQQDRGQKRISIRENGRSVHVAGCTSGASSKLRASLPSHTHTHTHPLFRISRPPPLFCNTCTLLHVSTCTLPDARTLLPHPASCTSPPLPLFISPLPLPRFLLFLLSTVDLDAAAVTGVAAAAARSLRRSAGCWLPLAPMLLPGLSFPTLVRRKRNCPPRSSRRFIAYGRVSSDELPSTKAYFYRNIDTTDTGNRMFHPRSGIFFLFRLIGSYRTIMISHDLQRGVSKIVHDGYTTLPSKRNARIERRD